MEITVPLEALHCCECDGVFLVPARLAKKFRDEGVKFFCPKGHAQVFTKPVIETLQERLNSAYARADGWEEAAGRWERRAKAAEAALKRSRRTVKKGAK